MAKWSSMVAWPWPQLLLLPSALHGHMIQYGREAIATAAGTTTNSPTHLEINIYNTNHNSVSATLLFMFYSILPFYIPVVTDYEVLGVDVLVTGHTRTQHGFSTNKPIRIRLLYV